MKGFIVTLGAALETKRKTLNWIFGPFRIMGLHKQNKLVCAPLKNRCVTKNIQEGLHKSKNKDQARALRLYFNIRQINGLYVFV